MFKLLFVILSICSLFASSSLSEGTLLPPDDHTYLGQAKKAFIEGLRGIEGVTFEGQNVSVQEDGVCDVEATRRYLTEKKSAALTFFDANVPPCYEGWEEERAQLEAYINLFIRDITGRMVELGISRYPYTNQYEAEST